DADLGAAVGCQGFHFVPPLATICRPSGTPIPSQSRPPTFFWRPRESCSTLPTTQTRYLTQLSWERAMRIGRPGTRRGSVLPLLGCCLIALFTFVALAIDIGLLAVSRTQSQQAADLAALIGARTLNNKPGVTDGNRANAIADAKVAL